MTTRPAAAPAATTGQWRPTWSPRPGNPDLPALTVVHDAHDDHAFMSAALTAHTPALGRITVHPTSVATAPASLAHDLLRSLNKHLLPGSEEADHWAGRTATAWRVVVAWTTALHIGHVIVTRAHRISPRHFEHLFGLLELTGIHLTLLCHGPLPPALASALTVLPYHGVHTLDGARPAVSTRLPPPPTDRYAWWEAATHIPPHADEPGLIQPTHSPPDHGRLDAASRRLGRTPLALPVGGRLPPEPDHATVLLTHRLHTRIAHPLHAAALAQRIATGRSDAPLQLSVVRAEGGGDLPVPPWAADLISAACRFAELDGRPPGRQSMQLAPWDRRAVDEAAHICGLLGHRLLSGGQARSSPPRTRAHLKE
ncbi:hypothetical protein ACIOGZ_22330 [Kitasatospora sp. NPDC088160]|uniref:hypothetical protein n=1 Tax=Kitasatospora sp. NPDC088160 TaxID=3364072 RepID=UPI003813714E